MFEKDMQITGKYATYWKALAQTPGNAVETSNNFKIFDMYMSVYMVAPIIGLMYGKRVSAESKSDASELGENKTGALDSAGMLAAVQIKNASKLKYIYRLLILTDTSEEWSDEERINLAFRESDEDAVIKGMKLYEEYFFGGLEILYNTFVQDCVTEDDFLKKMYEFVMEFKNEHGIDAMAVDIEALLSR